MTDIFMEMLSYPFMMRAIVVGVLVALCSSLLGVSLVLKRYSMIGDGLSHVGFGALAIATATNWAPLTVSIPLVLAAAFFLLRLSEDSRIKGDSAIALISTGSLAIGVMVISMTSGMNIDVYNYMFGSILAINSTDVILSVILSSVVLVLYLFFYSRIFAVTFDESFAKATGINAGMYNMLIALLTATNWAPLTVSIPLVLAAAFFLLRLSEDSRIKGDSAIALISTGSLAIGVMVISMTSGMNIDVYNYMFGSILAINSTDVILSVILSSVVLVLYLFFYSRIFAVTFDESFAKATGINAGMYNMLIALLTAVTIVLGMRLVGALLISSLIVFPAITSMRLFKSFRSVVISSAVISVVTFLTGIMASYIYATPAGASVVTFNIILFFVFSFTGYVTRRNRV